MNLPLSFRINHWNDSTCMSLFTCRLGHMDFPYNTNKFKWLEQFHTHEFYSHEYFQYTHNDLHSYLHILRNCFNITHSNFVYLFAVLY